ncbi:MAG: DUF4062 domain-containing protein [Ignavibacteria bacterium]|nr:DUF4062 domain-containing protein [Ignavibacteria bacterium]
MKHLLNKVFILSVLIFFIASCEEFQTDREAVRKTISEMLNGTIGFEWFPYEYSNYKPDSNICKQIDSLWKIKRYNFIVFVNPSCNCTETEKIFPSVIKSLKMGNVPDSSIFVYSMMNTSFSHPFRNKINIKSLPSCFTEIDSSNAIYYSCLDTLKIYQVKYPGKYRIEHILATSLEK